MKPILIFVIVLISSIAGAAPFLVCDPQEGVTQYKIIWQDSTEEIVIAQPDGSISRDLADIPVGERSGEYMAGKPWTIDGIPQEAMEWSPSVPFVLGRPSEPLLPMNTGLRK